MLRVRSIFLLLGGLALALAVQEAEGGAIRFTGKQIGRSSAYLAGAAASGGQTAAGGMATVGKAAGGATKAAAAAISEGAQATPGLAVRGTRAAAKGITKVMW